MTAAPAPRLRRTTFTTSRLAEFCSQRELTAQTGHPITDWPLVVVKELADNGLDIAEESGLAPEIEISVSTQDGEIIVADNGPGMPAETIASILDYSTRTSSREAYVSPTRGAQGNALKTLLAMPYALDGNRGETLIESQGVAHRIVFSVNQLRQEPQLEHDTTSSLVKTGTRITLQWPESASWILEAADNRFLQIADDLVFLNPHLSIRASWNGEPDLDWPATNPQWHKWRACDPTSPHWYDLARLERLAGAYINDDRKNGRLDRTLRAFVAEFRGLAATAKQKAVLDELGAARSSLASYSFDGAEQEANHDANYRLLAAMRAYSEPVKPDRLGFIGKEHLAARFAAEGVEPASFKYGRAIEITDGVPYVVEAAFGWCPAEARQTRRIITGVNWSAAIGNPFRTIGYESLDSLLTAQRAGPDEPIVFLLHFACPRIEYRDRGKSAISLPAGAGNKIVELVRSVTAAWCKQRKAEQRHAAAVRNRYDRLARPARKMSIKEAAWSVMSEAYARASDNGRLPANARQVMYAARPQIIGLTGKESLNDEYFTQTLLPDYIEANPAECKTWDVLYDARGSLIEPHTNRQIPLGTQDVRSYLNSTPEERTGVGGIPKSRRFATIGPENRYSSVLVIEKEGFDALLSRAAIRELYDIAIASTKGLSTVAARRAVDQLSARGVQVFGPHDFDVTGFTIFGILAKDSRRYRFDNAVPTLDIGLRLGDVQEMDLQSEPVTVSGDWSKRAETLAAHGATAAEIDFLKTRRVELNAMTSLQLVDLIKRKLAEHGVKKVIPDAAVMEQHARHWLELELADRALKRAIPQVKKQLAAIKLPPDLRQLVEAELQREPSLSWDFAVTNVLPPLPQGRRRRKTAGDDMPHRTSVSDPFSRPGGPG